MSQVDQLLQHELNLQRVATQLINKGLFKSLDEAYQAVRLILLGAETITSPTKLKTVERAITKAINEALTQGWAAYTSELENIAVYDSKYYANLIGAAAGITLTEPGKRTVTDFINAALMSLSSGKSPQVGLWGEFVRNNIDSMSEQVNNLVKAGYVNGATVDSVKKSIAQFMGFPDREKPAGMSDAAWQKVKDRTDGLAKQQVSTLARTGLQHYSQQARLAMTQANLDIVDREYPVVTFDNRLSDKCRGISVRYPKGWPVGDSPVGYPPYHFNCRTSLILGLKGQGDPRKGIDRPAIGSGENYESGDRYTGRASTKAGEFKVQQIDASTGFGTWLKRQDRTFIEDVLGKKRADLFLKGNLPIERMSDAFGNELTLEELFRLEAPAFKRAGVKP